MVDFLAPRQFDNCEKDENEQTNSFYLVTISHYHSAGTALVTIANTQGKPCSYVLTIIENEGRC